MSERKLRIGVIGAGWFASRRHLPVLTESPYGEIAALCRRSVEPLRQMAEHFGVTQTFTDYREMLDAIELDGVLIATPHVLHYEQAKEALTRGLHVLLEKPMALHAAEAMGLNRLARGRGLALLVAMNPPYWAHTQYLRQMIRSGKIGTLEAASINWIGDVRHVFGKVPMPDKMPGVVLPTLFRADPKAAGGGHLIDTGSHLVCELLWATGLRAVRVSALMDDPDTDLRCVINVELENGALCTLSILGDSEAGRRIQNTYFGSTGSLTVQGMPFQVTHTTGDGNQTITPDSDLPAPPQPVENFLDSILGRADVLCSGEDGERVVEVVEAAYRSVRTGKTITLR